MSPLSFRHFGIAYGHGVIGNLRRRPWLVVLLPAMLLSFARAARRASRGVELVHAHWLPAGAIAALTGRPFVVQLWGTDVELARRAPWLARLIMRRARLAICASEELAAAARELGAGTVRVIRSGVDLPDSVGEPDEPPHVLYAGRLSAEKGVLELVEAAHGLPLVVAGDGPLREQVPGAIGFVPHDRLLAMYEQAAVVVCPSRREGFGVVCAEAMAHARPVVATSVGGLRDLVVDQETGLLVPPADVRALRAALERLLADRDLRQRLGEGGRRRAEQTLTWERLVRLTLQAYEDALPSPSRRERARA